MARKAVSDEDTKLADGWLDARWPTSSETKEAVCDDHRNAGLRAMLHHDSLELRCRKCLVVVLRVTKKIVH
jgi:hypothetical protein